MFADLCPIIDLESSVRRVIKLKLERRTKAQTEGASLWSAVDSALFFFGTTRTELHTPPPRARSTKKTVG